MNSLFQYICCFLIESGFGEGLDEAINTVRKTFNRLKLMTKFEKFCHDSRWHDIIENQGFSSGFDFFATNEEVKRIIVSESYNNLRNLDLLSNSRMRSIHMKKIYDAAKIKNTTQEKELKLFLDAVYLMIETFWWETLSDDSKLAVGIALTISDKRFEKVEFQTERLRSDLEKHRSEIENYNINISASSSVSRNITSKSKQWKNDDFIGRDALINSLYADLSENYVHIQLTGMGGIGKTAILNRIYSDLAGSKESPFDHIGMLYFDGKIEGSFKNLDYPEQYKGFQGESVAMQFLRDLCNEKRVLLLFDDVRKLRDKSEDENFIAFLQTLRANMLVASRCEIRPLKKREVCALSTEDCILVFERQYEEKLSDEEAIVLGEFIEQKAGNNTKIVSRLGSMARCYQSIHELLDALERKGFCLPVGVDANDELLQQEINKLYPVEAISDCAEKNILEAFSLFPAIPLAKDTCVNWLMNDANVDEDNCSLLLARLANQTWLTKHESTDGNWYFSIHQMPSSAVRNQLEIEIKNHENLVRECADIIDKKLEHYLLKETAQYLPFASSIYESFSCKTPKLANLASSIGSHNIIVANYDEALEWYQKALEISEKVLGKEHPSTATTYNNIAGVYSRQGDYPKALEWYQKALEIHEKVLGKEHPSTATTYNNIAEVYYSQGDYPKALEWCHKALEIHEKVLGKEHPDTATIYNNIAGVYDSQGDYPKALEWYQKALEIREKVLSKEHPDTATTYNSIAGVYDDSQGDYPKALEWYQKALEINEKVFGKEHPSTATTYNNIAGVYSRQGDYPKALEWYQKALEIREKVLGKEHPDTATTYNNIAGVYYSQGDYPKALEWCQKALEIHEKVLGKEHPDTATIYNNIAGVYDSQGDYPKALEWYQKALEIREKVLSKEHPDTTTTYNSIAGVYSRQGDYPKALEWYQKALEIRENVLGNEHPSTATTYNIIAGVYYNQGDYPKALEWYQKALEIREKVLGKEHPDTAITYNNIAVVYSRQGDYPKALECCQKAIEIREKVLGKEHPSTATTYNNIAGVYSRQGDYPKALEWCQKALEIHEKVLGKEHPRTIRLYQSIEMIRKKL